MVFFSSLDLTLFCRREFLFGLDVILGKDNQAYTEGNEIPIQELEFFNFSIKKLISNEFFCLMNLL